MHAAAKDIPINLYSRIKSLVMFGDGYHRLGDVLSRFPLGLNHKVMQVCADGDPVNNDPSLQRLCHFDTPANSTCPRFAIGTGSARFTT
jgi:hypothetical protein